MDKEYYLEFYWRADKPGFYIYSNQPDFHNVFSDCIKQYGSPDKINVKENDTNIYSYFQY